MPEKMDIDIKDRIETPIMDIAERPTGALAVVPKAELDNIYKVGRVSPDVSNRFKSSLDTGISSSQGISIDQYIEMNRRLKIEMKEYLDKYKVQRNLMQAVIHYLRHPDLATVKFADKLGSLFGKKLQLEAKKIAQDPQAIRQLFEEMALSIEQSRGKTLELEKQAIVLYNTSLKQREDVEKDITDLLQKISLNKDRSIKLEDNINKVQENMDKLLKYMENLGIQIRGDRPILNEVSKPDTSITDTNTNDLLDKLIDEKDKIEQVVEEQGKENKEPEEDTRRKDKKKIEAIKVYHAINNELVKVENILRDATNEKLILHQNYEKAKENLILYERVLINQINEARNYFAMLFAIYDAEVKYTLPSARIIANLASLQEVAVQLTQQLYDSRNIFNNLLDSVTQGSLEIQEGILNLALNPSWDPVRLDQAETRTIELAKKTREFAIEMDKKMIEIEAIYRNPAIQGKVKERASLESGIEDQYLHKLLSDSKT